MNGLLRHLPNAMTCGNLLCGCLGILFLFQTPGRVTAPIPFGNLHIPVWPSYFILIAAVLDFLDGFVARLLKVQSPIGKELDSLADGVTFGVLPAFILYHLIGQSIIYRYVSTNNQHDLFSATYQPTYEYVALIIAVFSILRLAKFNIDTRQSDSFIGVPTPANALVVAALPLILVTQPQYARLILHPYVLMAYCVIMSGLMVSELPLFALKFKSFGWAENRIKYLFLAASAILLLFLQFAAVPLVIFLYIILSVFTK
ncbi:CDP-alcohol phosphatidyltransferase family protein [Larkinella soli]|uniref:CDP-alcohol phosphatidyltransferase family protein n=1 Tax=Larkinella soli TaxID=1770527 RepID=UPI000FFB297B|nr:CDP-alcohol phosphatidyltransferase family protein [Larkinella soli]